MYIVLLLPFQLLFLVSQKDADSNMLRKLLNYLYVAVTDAPMIKAVKLINATAETAAKLNERNSKNGGKKIERDGGSGEKIKQMQRQIRQ